MTFILILFLFLRVFDSLSQPQSHSHLNPINPDHISKSIFYLKQVPQCHNMAKICRVGINSWIIYRTANKMQFSNLRAKNQHERALKSSSSRTMSVTVYLCVFMLSIVHIVGLLWYKTKHLTQHLVLYNGIIHSFDFIKAQVWKILPSFLYSNCYWWKLNFCHYFFLYLMGKHNIPVAYLKKQKILHLTWSLLPLRSVVSWLLAPSARISSSDSTSLLLLELWAWANSLCRVALCPWVAATAMALQAHTLFIQHMPNKIFHKEFMMQNILSV